MERAKSNNFEHQTLYGGLRTDQSLMQFIISLTAQRNWWILVAILQQTSGHVSDFVSDLLYAKM